MKTIAISAMLALSVPAAALCQSPIPSPTPSPIQSPAQTLLDGPARTLRFTTRVLPPPPLRGGNMRPRSAPMPMGDAARRSVPMPIRDREVQGNVPFPGQDGAADNYEIHDFILRNRGDQQISVVLLDAASQQCGATDIGAGGAMNVYACGNGSRLFWHDSHRVRDMQVAAGHAYEFFWDDAADGWNLMEITDTLQ